MNKYEGKLTKPYEAAVFSYEVLKKLGSGKVVTFSDRFISQKTQYFAQLFGVSPSYQFNLYLRGPYSPALTQDLFAICGIDSDYQKKRFVSDELEDRFEQLKDFLKGKEPRQLEIIATLHWLLEVAELSIPDVKKKMIQLKEVTDIEFSQALKSIQVIRKQIK